MDDVEAPACEHTDTDGSCTCCLFVMREMNAIDYHIARIAHPTTVNHARREGALNGFDLYLAYLPQTADATNASIFGG